MKLDFLNTVPYLCDRWAEVLREDPGAVFLTEEASGKNMTRQELRTGGVAVFGSLWNRDVEWKILTVDRGRALIAARASVIVKPYSRDGAPASWTDCSLRRWLNRVFLSMAFFFGKYCLS